jgi:hypothetical protein|eukprot:COSAG06_NODE_9885_length_1796_cov_6.540955_2_plen_67_part_00
MQNPALPLAIISSEIQILYRSSTVCSSQQQQLDKRQFRVRSVIRRLDRFQRHLSDEGPPAKNATLF